MTAEFSPANKRQIQSNSNLTSSVVIHVGKFRHETSKFLPRLLAASHDVRQTTLDVSTE